MTLLCTHNDLPFYGDDDTMSESSITTGNIMMPVTPPDDDDDVKLLDVSVGTVTIDVSVGTVTIDVGVGTVAIDVGAEGAGTLEGVGSVLFNPGEKVLVSGQSVKVIHSQGIGNVTNPSPRLISGVSSRTDVSQVPHAVTFSMYGTHGLMKKSAATQVRVPTPVKFIVPNGGRVGGSSTLNVQALGQFDASAQSQTSGI
jgi:hypothetical protein